MDLEQKETALRSFIRDCESTVVAYSGGVDSALVLTVAHQELGEKVIGVTAHSPSVPLREREAADAFAKQIGVRHQVIETGEVNLPEYRQNPANRCFFCKTELYSHLIRFAKEEGFTTLLNGTNCDDLGDHRPGLNAAENFHVKSPLVEAGMTKQDVRALSKKMRLPLWEKPASPCLASRIPYGQEVNEEKLLMVEQAEDYLLSLGYRELRVRHFGNTARIELPVGEIKTLREGSHWQETKERFTEIGFHEIEVDEEGFRSGKLNASLT
ncbi:MAG: ATP-dependent sacrificial sulfur transferase LarE [Candidatus Nitronauta litoralis]|uniref:ATP-dependent sacrificial sulfur transferase LarE n=1 Tax=Candidatus Nitronauta litoralis TaxID=2705533 RepID=A0A7T0FYK9_9BACT|nr:MAG: ATP-dependent sacrificial sulfur transferase LarE [Candidatus Nitronauta litoralis]